MTRVWSMLLLLAALIASTAAAATINVVNGEEYLWTAGGGQAQTFSYSTDGTAIPITVLGFYSGSYFDLYCAIGYTPSASRSQWSMSASAPRIVLPSGTSGYTRGTMYCTVLPRESGASGFNITQGHMTGEIHTGLSFSQYVSSSSHPAYEYRVSDFAKAAGVIIECTVSGYACTIWASVVTSRPEFKPSWSANNKLIITGSALSSALATRHLKDRLFVSFGSSAALTFKMLLSYNAPINDLANAIPVTTTVAMGTPTEQRFYRVAINTAVQGQTISVTASPHANEKTAFLYASVINVNPGPNSALWRSTLASGTQEILLKPADFSKTSYVYYTVIAQSTQVTNVTIELLTPAEPPVMLANGAPYTATIGAGTFAYMQLQITPDMVSQTLTVNDTATTTTFYASMTNVRPSSATATWTGGALKIVPSDTNYKQGFMYISLYSSAAVVATVLASTPNQGGSTSVLRNGTVANGIVPLGGYNYYSLATAQNSITEVQVIPDRGMAFLYASYDTTLPTSGDFEWASTYNGPNGLLLGPGTNGYKTGTLFISVYGKTACNYKLTVMIY